MISLNFLYDVLVSLWKQSTFTNKYSAIIVKTCMVKCLVGFFAHLSTFFNYRFIHQFKILMLLTFILLLLSINLANPYLI